MKEVYSFDVQRQVQREVPHVKKTKDGPVETTKKVKKTIKNRVIFVKPSISQLEDAEFFYGQKYNEFINAGFLTKAMLAKKMGDLGGLTSKSQEEVVAELISENVESARVIEFFSGAKELDEEQKKQLDEANKSFTTTAKIIQETELNLRSQFSQTPDAKAEQKLIEWLVVNFSYYEDRLEKEDKKRLFALFEGENYDEKRGFMLRLQDEDEEIEDAVLLKSKRLYDSAFETLIRVASIWYNKLGNDQKSVEQSLKDLFDVDEKTE